MNLEENFNKMQTDIEAKYGKKVCFKSWIIPEMKDTYSSSIQFQNSDIKFDRESYVVLRKPSHAMQSIAEMNNRLSETSMNSSE